jgi:hypothetical protein
MPIAEPRNEWNSASNSQHILICVIRLKNSFTINRILFLLFTGATDLCICGGGHAVAWMVEALCYELEGRGFEIR